MNKALIRTFGFAYRNAIFAKRNVFAVAEMMFWPLVGIFSIGLMSDFLKFQENALQFVLTGAIASGVLQVAQLDVAYGMMYDVWSKSLKHTFLAPVHLLEFSIGSWTVGILRGSIIFSLLVIASHFSFQFHLPGLQTTAYFLLGLFLTALILGMGVMVLILRYGQRAEITTWMLAPLGMLLCGFYYPVDYLPKSLMTLAKFLPLTYDLEILRAGYGFPPSSYALAKMLGLCVVYGMVVLFLLRKSLVKARMEGTLVRLSE